MNPSAEQIIGIARDLMRSESGTDVTALSDPFLLKVVADVDKRLLRMYRRGGGNVPVDRALEWGATLAPETTVNDATGVQTTDTTITVDAQTFLDASGALSIWTRGMPDVVYYASKTSLLFSGVTGIGFDHVDNDAVQALPKLPSNFGQFRRSEEYGDGVMLNGTPLTYMEGPPTPGHFSLRDNGTNKFLWLPQGSGGIVAALFNSDSNTIDSTDDLVSLSDDWQFVYAWRCIELGMFGRGDFELISLAKSMGDAAQLEILKDRNIGRRVRVRPLMMIGTRRIPEIQND